MSGTATKSLLFIMTLIWFFGVRAYGATLNAASCSLGDVQAAVGASASGDVIAVPSGSCSWGGYVNIPTQKKLVVSGAGIGKTVISASQSQAIVIELRESGSRITGFTFVDGKIRTNGKNWRIDHCRFEYSCASGGTIHEGVNVIADTGLGYTESVKGVIDHNEFHNMRVVASGGPSLMANEVWARPLGLGTDEAVYVEDNSFTYAICTTIQAMDANYGGAYVFRHNKIQDASVMAHAVQAQNRATRKWEVYDNVFYQVGNAAFPGFIRAGTGVWFNNELVGTWTRPVILLDEQRSCLDFSSKPPEYGCDGNSPWDGNTAGGAGYPCRDQIGRSTDSPQWVSTPGSEGPYTQALEPAYAWNNWRYPTETDRVNKTRGVALLMEVKNVCPAEAAHIQSGRDFFNSGMVPKPGYAPYSYPHPLTVDTILRPPVLRVEQ